MVLEEQEEEFGEIYDYDWSDGDDMEWKDKEPQDEDWEWNMDEAMTVWDDTFGNFAQITKIIPSLVAVGLLTVNY